MNMNIALEDAKVIARKAGRILLDNYEKDIKFRTKSSDADIVTEADILSENEIIKNIKEKYPDCAILSEEKGAVPGNEYMWVIDPLDGTTNYFNGLPYFAVSIALLKDMNPVAGVVYCPRLDEMFSAMSGEGAYLNDKKIHVSNEQRISSAIVGTGFPYDRLISSENGFDLFNVIIKKVRSIRINGSASLDICSVACGRLDGYWHLKLGLWDIAACGLILMESGGKMIEDKTHKADGEEAINVIAGNNSICDQIHSAIYKNH